MSPSVREPRQSRSALTKEKILDAALFIFAEQGFDAASIRDIANRAGATHPMITYHFGNKDKLWRAAVSEMFDRLGREVIEPSLSEGDDPSTTFRKLVFHYVRYCAQHPEHARLTIAETVRGGDRLEWMVETFVRANQQVIFGRAEKLMERGDIPRMSPVAFLYALVGMCQLPFVIAREAEAALGIDITDEAAVEAHTEAVFQLLFREKAPATPL